MSRSYLSMASAVAIVFAMTVALSVTANAKPRVQQFTVKITERGFEPETLKLRRGVPTRIKFLRTTDNTCATEIVITEFAIRRGLPLNQPVTVSFTPNKKGEFDFTCGMNMMRGRLIVQ